MSRDNGDLFNSLELFGRRSRRSVSDDASGSGRRPGRDPGNSGVKRSLFGRGNHEENIKFAQNELKRSLTESKKRWNFDFESGNPLEGRYLWESSGSGSRQSRKPYSRDRENSENHHPSSLPSKNSTCDNDSGAATENGSKSMTSDALATAEVLSASAGASASCQRTPQQQSSIIDHFRQRKRSKSKVKMQERKQDSRDGTPPPPSLTTTTTSATESD